MTRWWFASLFSLSLFWFCGLRAGEPPVSFEFHKTPLTDAMRTVIREHRLPLIFSEEMLASYQVTARCLSCSPEQALELLLNGTPFQARYESGRFYLVDMRDIWGSVQGVVRHKNEGTPVRGVAFMLVDDQGEEIAQVFSDSQGHFSFEEIMPGSYQLGLRGGWFQVSPAEVVEVVSGQTVSLQLMLDIPERPLQELVVTPSRFVLMVEGFNADHFLNEEELSRLPHLGDDVYRAANLFPGTSGSDLSAGFHVRGSTKQELSVLIDGMEIQDPFHLRQLFSGLVSILDSQAVGNVELLTGVFPSEYGNTTGGVFRVNSREPETSRHSAGVNFLNLRAATEGRFKKRDGGYLISARHGFLDIALDLTEGDENDDENVYYQDVYAKFEWKPDSLNKIRFHLLGAADHFYLREVFHEAGFEEQAFSFEENQRLLAWAGWERIWENGLRMDAVIGGGATSGESSADDQEGSIAFDVLDQRDYAYLSLRTDFQFPWGEDHVFKWGLSAGHQKAEYNYRDHKVPFFTNLGYYGGDRELHTTAEQNRFGLYFSDRIRLSKSWLLEAGLRYDAQSNPGDSQWSPRLHIGYQDGKTRTLKLGWALLHQPFSVFHLNVPDGDPRIYSAQSAQHWVANYEQRFFSGLRTQFEIFYKDFRDPYPRYENYLNTADTFLQMEQDRFLLQPEKARALGFEASLYWRGSEKFNAMLNYSWSKAEDWVGGRWVSRYWDQQDDINLLLDFRPRLHWSLNLSAKYHTGWHTTPLNIEPDESGILKPGDLYSIRFRPYQRFDFRISRTWKDRRGRELLVFLDLFNITGRANIRAYENHRVVPASDGGPELLWNVESWLPRLPSLGVTWRF